MVNNRQEAPTKEQLQELDCLKDSDLFETMRKILKIPMEVKKIRAKRRLMDIRVRQKAYVEKQQSVQLLSDGHRIRSFQMSFCDSSECSNYRSEENVENE